MIHTITVNKMIIYKHNKLKHHKPKILDKTCTFHVDHEHIHINI